MYLPASSACNEPNSESPMPAGLIAAKTAGAAQYQDAFTNGNAALNNLVVAMGGNPPAVRGTDPIAGDAGIPTTGAYIPPFPAADRLRDFLASGGGNLRTLRGSANGSASCSPPKAQPMVAFIPLPAVNIPQAAAVAPVASAPKADAAPAAAKAAPVCVRKGWKGSGALPDRDYQECTIGGVYSCGWNDYMESLNWDRPFSSPEAKAAAELKYQNCVKYGNRPGLSGVLTDGSGAAVLWGSVGFAVFALWAANEFSKKGGRR